MKVHSYYTYITTNPAKKVLYTGMTNDLAQRMVEHYLNRGHTKTFAGRFTVTYWFTMKNING